MLNKNERATIWINQDWDDPDLYHIKFDGEEIDLLTRAKLRSNIQEMNICI